jgi:hypothetical protein
MTERNLTKEQKYVNQVLGDCRFCWNPIYEDGMVFTNLDEKDSPTKSYHRKCFKKQQEVIKMLTEVLKSAEELEKKEYE